MSTPAPHEDWTDDEWIRAMREFAPDTPVSAAEAAVGQWRDEGEQ